MENRTQVVAVNDNAPGAISGAASEKMDGLT
ncbi:hypothetical protein ABIF81_000885 [Bradyrhizobium daqingense]